MSEIKYKTGWIKDPEGNKFAPITTTDQVITSDGADLASEINNIKNDVTTLNSKMDLLVGSVSTQYGDIYYRKRCGQVQLYIYGLQNLTANAYTHIYTLPTELIPVFGMDNDFTAPDTTNSVRVNINEYGEINVYNYTSITGGLNINPCISYMAAEF